MTFHVLHAVGARPNFVKMAPIIDALAPHDVRQTVVHTGQHYDERMSSEVMDQLGFRRPDVFLGIGSGTHGEQTGRALIEVEQVLLESRPDVVCVGGDVNSTLAVALAASKLMIPVAHVEAGLRSFDWRMPEEINRVLTDRLSDLLFTHSPEAADNLAAEGIDRTRIHFVGNTMIDSLRRFEPGARLRRPWERVDVAEGEYVLATLHRPSNVDDDAQLRRIVAALIDLSERAPVVFPIHPRTRARLVAADLLSVLERAGVRCHAPVPYLDFVGLEARAGAIVTDSGGVQEEATALGVPCYTLRPNTERPITVAQGTNTLLGDDPAAIRDIPLAGAIKSIGEIAGWDGHASERVAEVLAGTFGARPSAPGRRLVRTKYPLSDDRVQLFGCAVDPLEMQAAVARCEQAIETRSPIQHMAINAAKVVAMQKDERLLDIVNSCELVTADGQSVVWASRVLGAPLPGRVAGIDLMHELMALAERKQYRVYLLGAEREVLDRAVARLREQHPDLAIAGHHDGYFSDDEEPAVAAEIRASRPDMLFVAMPSPQKEYFLSRWSDELEIPLTMGVGGAIDVVAGVRRRAPVLLQRLGLEWSFRLAQEPKRLFRRYLMTNTRFLSMVVAHRLRRQLAREPTDRTTRPERERARRRMFTHTAAKRHVAPREQTSGTRHDAEPTRRFGRSGAAPTPQAARDLVVESPGARPFSRDVLFRRLLLVADLTAASVAACAILLVFEGHGPGLAALVLPAIVPVVFTSMGLYRRDELVLSTNTLDEGPLLFQASTLSALAAYLLESGLVATPLGAQQIALMLVVLTAASALFRVCARDVARRLSPPERCLLVGSGDVASRLSNKFASAPTVKATLVGQIPLDRGDNAEELSQRVSEDNVHRVVIAGEGAPPERVHHMIQSSKALGVKVSLLPRMFEVVGSSVAFDYFGGMTVLGVRRFGLSRRQRIAKRAFDVTGSLLLIVLLAPLIALIALAVRLTSSGPVLFRQLRVGRDDNHFELLKFRSMCVDADARKPELLDRNEADGLFKIDDDPRVTRVGRILRRTCLDELPQLINVLRGEMSLVGPRPLVLAEDERIQGYYRSRLHLMPGMTGPWQVLGSARIPLREMMSIDYLYVANWSLWGDVKILLRTVPVVMLRRGQ